MVTDFVPYETAKQLKDLGFDTPCLAWWFKDVTVPNETRSFWKDWNQYPSGIRFSAPLWQQVIDWLEDKHGMGVETYTDVTLAWNWKLTPLHFKATHQHQVYSTYVTMGRKECIRTAVKEAIKILSDVQIH